MHRRRERAWYDDVMGTLTIVDRRYIRPILIWTNRLPAQKQRPRPLRCSLADHLSAERTKTTGTPRSRPSARPPQLQRERPCTPRLTAPGPVRTTRVITCRLGRSSPPWRHLHQRHLPHHGRPSVRARRSITQVKEARTQTNSVRCEACSSSPLRLQPKPQMRGHQSADSGSASRASRWWMHV
jgi:hypothetical protein